MIFVDKWNVQLRREPQVGYLCLRFVTGSGKIDLKAHNTKIELLVPADSPMFGEYSNGQSASIAHSVAKK